MWLAAHAPDRVRAAGAALHLGRSARPSSGGTRAATVRAEGMAGDRRRVVGPLVHPGLRRRRPDVVAAHCATMLAATPADGYAACCEAIARMDLRADLARITAPTLVIAGGRRPGHAAGARRARSPARIPARGWSCSTGAAHLANVERPDAGAPTLLLDHLRAQVTDDDPSGTSAAWRCAGRCSATRTWTARSPARRVHRAFQDFITRYAWGEIWTRPGLDRRTRSCITLAVLAALRPRRRAGDARRAAALRNGLTPEEMARGAAPGRRLRGVPAANAAFRVARETLRQEAG